MADYTVYSGSVSGTPLQVARDLVRGSFDDYYFFRASDTTYVLISGDFDCAALSGSVCTVYTIYSDSSYMGGGYHLVSGTRSTVSVSNPSGFLAYGSSDALPSLSEGGERYAFAEILLLGICACFVLIDRIFKHVS